MGKPPRIDTMAFVLRLPQQFARNATGQERLAGAQRQFPIPLDNRVMANVGKASAFIQTQVVEFGNGFVAVRIDEKRFGEGIACTSDNPAESLCSTFTKPAW